MFKPDVVRDCRNENVITRLHRNDRAIGSLTQLLAIVPGRRKADDCAPTREDARGQPRMDESGRARSGRSAAKRAERRPIR